MQANKVITLVTPFNLNQPNTELIVEHPLLDTYLQNKYKIVDFSQSTLSLLEGNQVIVTTFILEEVIEFSY
jgi:hypothetical protein